MPQITQQSVNLLFCFLIETKMLCWQCITSVYMFVTFCIHGREINVRGIINLTED